MRPPRRTLSGEEMRLWSAVAKFIEPLRGRTGPVGDGAAGRADPRPSTKPLEAPRPVPDAQRPVEPAGPSPTHQVSPTQIPARPTPPRRLTALADLSSAAARAAVRPVPPPVALPAPPPASGLERRVRVALRRGTLRVDARIDLHGMRQVEAHGALIAFLTRARAAGHVHVLVVTGKGGGGYDAAFSERGVLRRSVPHWLRAPELRPVVLGFEEAARHHGGAGALYVRLRRG